MRRADGSGRAAFAFVAGVALHGGVVDVVWGLIPAVGFFVEHGVVGLRGEAGLAGLGGGAVVDDVLGVDLTGRLGVGDGFVDAVGALLGSGARVVVEAAHARFLVRLGAFVAAGGIRRVFVCHRRSLIRGLIIPGGPRSHEWQIPRGVRRKR